MERFGTNLSEIPNNEVAPWLSLKGMVWAQPASRLRETLETYTNIRNKVEGSQLRVGDDINVIRMAYVAPTYEDAKKEADSLFTPLFTNQFERLPDSYWYKKGERSPKGYISTGNF